MENRYYLGTASDGSVTLQHHGIPGMKWGVRRTPEELGYKPYYKGGKYKIDSIQRSIGRKTNGLMNKAALTRHLERKAGSKHPLLAEQLARSRKKTEALINNQKLMQKEYSSLKNGTRARIKIARGVKAIMPTLGAIGALVGVAASYSPYGLPSLALQNATLVTGALAGLGAGKLVDKAAGTGSIQRRVDNKKNRNRR